MNTKQRKTYTEDIGSNIGRDKLGAKGKRRWGTDDSCNYCLLCSSSFRSLGERRRQILHKDGKEWWYQSTRHTDGLWRCGWRTDDKNAVRGWSLQKWKWQEIVCLLSLSFHSMTYYEQWGVISSFDEGGNRRKDGENSFERRRKTRECWNENIAS